MRFVLYLHKTIRLIDSNTNVTFFSQYYFWLLFVSTNRVQNRSRIHSVSRHTHTSAQIVNTARRFPSSDILLIYPIENPYIFRFEIPFTNNNNNKKEHGRDSITISSGVDTIFFSRDGRSQRSFHNNNWVVLCNFILFSRNTIC